MFCNKTIQKLNYGGGGGGGGGRVGVGVGGGARVSECFLLRIQI